MEENKRAVMEIIIKINDSIPPTAADTALLESIAYTPAIVGGTAVYMARAILAIEVDDEWLTSSFRTANDKQKENKNELYICPNPAKDFVFIRGKGITSVEIRNMAGVVLKKQTFNYQGDAIVSVSLLNYSQGVYQVKASSETEEKTAKLIIIR